MLRAGSTEGKQDSLRHLPSSCEEEKEKNASFMNFKHIHVQKYNILIDLLKYTDSEQSVLEFWGLILAMALLSVD